MEYITGPELLQLERGHLLRLLLWAGASILAGALFLLLSRAAGASGDFWKHAGIQSAAWGLVDAAIVAFAWPSLAMRTVSEAIALDRFLWLNIGLDVGYVMVGATLLAFGLRRPRRLGLVGAGAAIVVQGLALALLDAYLSTRIVH